MEGVLDFFSLESLAANAAYLWLSVGILLLAGEMALPGVYLMWLGGAAVVTGVVSFAAPDAGFEIQSVVFAVLATVSIYLGNRFFYGASGEPDDNQATQGAHRLIGAQVEVLEDIVHGRGAVRVADGRWIANGPDLKAGSFARVTGVDGVVLVVEELTEGTGPTTT